MNPDIYENAADAIDTYGWIQGAAGNVSVGFCAYGALWHVAPNDHEWIAAVNNIDKVVQQDPGFFGLIDYNDTLGRTQGEVTDLLRHTAKDLRNDA